MKLMVLWIQAQFHLGMVALLSQSIDLLQEFGASVPASCDWKP